MFAVIANTSQTHSLMVFDLQIYVYDVTVHCILQSLICSNADLALTHVLDDQVTSGQHKCCTLRMQCTQVFWVTLF